MTQKPLFVASELCKTYEGPPPVNVLESVSLAIAKGESVAIQGKSGEGKSTLLHILGTLEKPSSGSLLFKGEEIPSQDLASFRNQEVGFIFQSYHLLDDFSVLDNVLIPLRIGRKNREEGIERAKHLLKAVGIENKEKSLAKHLSGGEKQRVAIARALCNSPSLILADEPTGNLDNTHSHDVQDLLLCSARCEGASLIVVTHDTAFAERCDRVLFLNQGQLYTDPQ